MTAVIPYSLTFTLLAAGIMQRLAVGKLRQTDCEREARFSLCSSYVCFGAALAALAAGAFFS